MSALAAPQRAAAPATEHAPRRRRESARLFEPGRVTLDARVAGIWEELRSAGRAGCPICGAELVAGDGCAGCGAELT